MPKQPSAEEILEKIELVKKLLEKLSNSKREFVKDMMNGPVGKYYFTAPASSREEFHSCYPGGLTVHSLNVVANLRKLSQALCPDRYEISTLIFVGLFHDLGKIGDGIHEYYVPNESDWARKKGMLYEINKECVWMPTSERGLYILQRNMIQLTSDEYLAIRLNDGQYTEENKGYRMKEPELALLVHWADMWAVKQEKQSSRA